MRGFFLLKKERSGKMQGV